jgi:hypothetical protein
MAEEIERAAWCYKELKRYTPSADMQAMLPIRGGW